MRRLGLSLLPENRAVQGLFINRSIRENLTAVTLDQCSRSGWLDRRGERELAGRLVADMNIKVGTIEDEISTLSGGNQQKAVIGKWIASRPKLFIMDSPTVGIDVGSKAEIYRRIQAYAAQGMAILLISDEIEEIVLNCNRIMVMSQGRIVRLIEEEERDRVVPDELEKQIERIVNESGADEKPAGKGGRA